MGVTITLTEEQLLALKASVRWCKSAMGDDWQRHHTADAKKLERLLNRALDKFDEDEDEDERCRCGKFERDCDC